LKKREWGQLMRSLKRILVLSIGIPIFSINQTLAASSDGFPWSVPAQSVDGSSVHVDQNGALTDISSQNQSNSNSIDTGNFSKATSLSVQTGTTPAGGSSDGGEVAQGNVGSTQSGPGASGLFTPNSPGNSAALSAQMHGGLEGSPIVDGVGSNLRITVPVSTPSLSPSYEQVTNGGIVGVTRNTVLNDPDAAHIMPVQNSSSLSPVIQAFPQNSGRRSLSSAYSSSAVKTPPKANGLGRVNGSIDYGNGDKVLFGSGGVESIHKTKNAVLQLNDGRTITKKTRI
jgi:hypothetical protein